MTVGKNGRIWIKPDVLEHAVYLVNLFKKAATLSEDDQLQLV